MDLQGMLAGIATVAGVLLTFSALILFAMQKLSDTQGGRGEGMLISCVIGAVACYAAAVYIRAQSGAFNIFGS